MIVKDEAHCIARCLESVRPHIGSWVVCDTGSSDATPEIVAEVLAGIPGEVRHHPWRGFAHNRNLALEAAHGRAPYILLIDADDRLVCDADPFTALRDDAYTVEFHHDQLLYRRIAVLRDGRGWRFVGAVHEHPVMDGPHSVGDLRACHILYGADGARSRDPHRYLADARLLEEELAADPHNTRSAFYLAQSYRDAGLTARAIDAYLRRAGMGGWEEEVYCSLVLAGMLQRQIGRPLAEVVDTLLRAYEQRPTRLESLVHLMEALRCERRFHTAHLIGSRALRMPPPAGDMLFVDPTCRWRLRDELAVAAYWVGDHPLCRSLCRELLDDPDVPDTERERIARNLRESEGAERAA